MFVGCDVGGLLNLATMLDGFELSWAKNNFGAFAPGPRRCLSQNAVPHPGPRPPSSRTWETHMAAPLLRPLLRCPWRLTAFQGCHFRADRTEVLGEAAGPAC
jgi:hypothetical protein